VSSTQRGQLAGTNDSVRFGGKQKGKKDHLTGKPE
jgi:hypothetical protein